MSASQWSIRTLALRISPRNKPPWTSTSTREKMTPASPVSSLPRSESRVFRAKQNTADLHAGDGGGGVAAWECSVGAGGAGQFGDRPEIVDFPVGHGARPD